MIPSNEQPVSSAQIPNVPPKLAILSVRVVLAFNTVTSTSGLKYLSLIMMISFMILKSLRDLITLLRSASLDILKFMLNSILIEHQTFWYLRSRLLLHPYSDSQKQHDWKDQVWIDIHQDSLNVGICSMDKC